MEKTRPTDKDIKDWFLKKGWNKKVIAKNKFLFAIPIIGSNPSNGFIYGAGLTYIYKKKYSERFSVFSSNATYSTKESLNLNARSNIFWMKDKLVLNGDWQYFIFTESTYGLGGLPNLEEQSLEYSHIRFHETASWKVFPDLFAGIGFHYDRYQNIQDETTINGNANTSYYSLYNLKHGFNQKDNTTVGLSLNFLFDNRDNTVNSYKGYYANINYRINKTGLGSNANSNLLLTDLRTFHSLDVAKRHVIALWLYGNFVLSGDVPYLLLPALGYDQRQRSGRGYAFGYLRGQNLLYVEPEYRFPISANTNILGGVVFANFTSTSSYENNIKLFNYIWGAYGTGIRVMLDKHSRARLDLDVAIGNKVGFYLGIKETF
ncbi:MAG: BamA/TamA family outer membrane protein [Bacteroidota bacterium]|nr:BamA/TamA family outer membrane protein [Bacteroidota bacterium]